MNKTPEPSSVEHIESPSPTLRDAEPTLQEKIAVYLNLLRERTETPKEGDETELLTEQLRGFERVATDQHVMAFAKFFLKRMRKDEKDFAPYGQGPTWSMWYVKEDADMSKPSEAGTYLTPFPDTMISIGTAVELMVDSELHHRGNENALGNVSVMHNTGFDKHEQIRTGGKSTMDLEQRDGESSQEWLQRTLPQIIPPSLYSFDNKSNEARWPSRCMPPVRYQVSGYGTEDLVEGLQAAWDKEEQVQKEIDRRSDNTRGELVLLELEGYDWNRKSWFQSSLAQVRKQTGMTGEEFLRLLEDTFRGNRQFAHEAIRNFRTQGHTGAASIDNSLNALRKMRLESSPEYKEELKKEKIARYITGN